MNQNAIDYLRNNKDAHPKEVLIGELRRAGYAENDILESALEVFGTELGADPIPVPMAVGAGFWDFKNKKIYQNKSEKIKDFLLGFFGIWGLGVFLAVLLEVAEDGLLDFFMDTLFDFDDILELLLAGWVSVFDELKDLSILFLGFFIFILVYTFRKRRHIFYGLISYPLVMVALVMFFLFVYFNFFGGTIF